MFQSSQARYKLLRWSRRAQGMTPSTRQSLLETRWEEATAPGRPPWSASNMMKPWCHTVGVLLNTCSMKHSVGWFLSVPNCLGTNGLGKLWKATGYHLRKSAIIARSSSEQAYVPPILVNCCLVSNIFWFSNLNWATNWQAHFAGSWCKHQPANHELFRCFMISH